MVLGMPQMRTMEKPPLGIVRRTDHVVCVPDMELTAPVTGTVAIVHQSGAQRPRMIARHELSQRTRAALRAAAAARGMDEVSLTARLLTVIARDALFSAVLDDAK